jgi:hypothetical protein
MIIEWVNTGRPVYYHSLETHKWELCDGTIGWFPEFEYSFDPPKIKYRVALMKCHDHIYVDIFNKECQQKAGEIVKWLTDWQEVEV